MKRLRDQSRREVPAVRGLRLGCEPIPIDRGKANMSALPVGAGLLARTVTRVKMIQHRGCRRASRPN